MSKGKNSVQVSDGIFRELKVIAAALGRTMTDLVASGIRREIDAQTRGNESLLRLLEQFRKPEER